MRKLNISIMSFFNLPRRLLERVYGPEFASWEMSRLHDFKKRKDDRDKILLGYCTDPTDESFVLIPLPHLTQTYIDCRCHGIVLPPENAFIQIEGGWRPHGRKKHNTCGTGWVFVVENIKLKKDQYLKFLMMTSRPPSSRDGLTWTPWLKGTWRGS